MAGQDEVLAGGALGRLRARHGELVPAILARVQGDAFDHAGGHDAEYVAGLHAAVAAAVEYALQGIEHGEHWTGPIPPAAAQQARRAARVGVSLDIVLRRYVLGSALLGEYILEEADRGERKALRGALRAQAAALDRMLRVVTAAYADEQSRTQRSPERRRFEGVRTLLDDPTRQYPQLDYELDAWHLGLIATGGRAADLLRELAAASAAGHRLLSVQPTERSVWAWLGGNDRLAVRDLEQVHARAPASHGVLLALGEPGLGPQGWRLTHQQAQAALAVALHHPRALTRYVDVALLSAALKDQTLAKALIETYLTPLDDSRNRGVTLRQTLQTYVACERNTSSTAIKLNVSRSTVEDRLHTIEERLERPLHPCPPELEIALELHRITNSAHCDITSR
jgi:PucR C-terminal helix-turn-helix domain